MAGQYTHLHAIVNQDGAAILDIKSGRITTLNTSAGFVWQALENGQEIMTIADSLARETGQDLEVVRRDVTEFIEALKKHDLLPG